MPYIQSVTWDDGQGSTNFGFSPTKTTFDTYITLAVVNDGGGSPQNYQVYIWAGLPNGGNSQVGQVTATRKTTESWGWLFQAKYTFTWDEWQEYSKKTTGGTTTQAEYVTVWANSNGITSSSRNVTFTDLPFPIVESVTWQSPITDVVIQGVTEVSWDAVIKSMSSAPIQSARVAMGGAATALTEGSDDHWTGTQSAPTLSGRQYGHIYATDGYGTRAITDSSTAVYIQVKAHSEPVLSTEIFRCDSDGEPNSSGAYLSVTAYASSVPTELGIHSLEMEGTAGGTISEFINSGQTYIIGNGLIDSDDAYSLTFTATDNSATYGGTALVTTVTVGVPAVVRIINVKDGGTGAAFGKLATEDEMVDTDWIYRTGKSGSGDNAGVQVRHSVAQADAEVLARRDDTGNGVSLLVGADGNNRGLYNRSDTNAGWIMYLGADGEIHFGKPVDPTNIPDASASQRGLVSTGAQTFAGAKQFNNGISVISGLNVTNTIANGVSAPIFRISDAPSANAEYGRIFLSYENYGGRINFREYSGSASARTSYFEKYQLPIPSAGRTSNATYNIITDKDPSTSANLLGVPNIGGYGTALKAGDNVDTDLEMGHTYYSGGASISAALAGTPPTTTTGFKIMQIRSYANANYAYQIAFGAEERFYVRARATGSTWGVWGMLLDSRHTLTIAQGGTGQTAVTKTSTIADIITASSAVTITSANYAQWGKVAQLTIEFKNVNAINVTATGNITDLVIGTLVAGKRPAFQLDGLLTGYSNGAGVGHGYLFANGNLGFTDFEARSAAYTIAANTTLRVSAVYILA